MPPRNTRLMRSARWYDGIRPCGLRGHLVPLATALTLLVAAQAPAHLDAQGITLPTIRTFGSKPEERLMFRLIRQLRPQYDSLAAGTDAADRDLAKAMLRRLRLLEIASLSQRQIDEFREASLESEQLQVLAGSRYMPDDPVPRQLRQTLLQLFSEVRRATDAACQTSDRSAKARSDSAQNAVANFLAVRIAAVTSSGVCPEDSTSTPAARQWPANLASVAATASRERDPALFVSAAIERELGTGGDPVRAAKLDTLARAATAVIVARKIGRWHGVLPLTSREQAAAFWRQRGWSPLNVGSLTGSSRAGATFTELASPLLKAARVSVNAILAAGRDPATTTPPAGTPRPSPELQRFLAGGGLFNVSFAYPLYYQGWKERTVDVMLIAVPRFGATAPVLGATADDTRSLSADAGLELHAKMVDPVDGVGIVTQLRWGNARGSRAFVESLGIGGKHTVSYATAAVGFQFARQYMITASRAFGGPRAIRTAPWQVGLSIFRSGESVPGT
ncbi:MAG: hypothetical protein MUF21_10150 [Gemmatimonadaceae bacterium]|nr:hypothetical protein [Gemmatimonadaceae bacterium]